MKTCTTCNTEVTKDYVEFKCPQSKTKIIRCFDCRKNSRTYTCPDCGFVGP